MDDFDETVCHFFDDGDPIINDYQRYNITEGQNKLLVRFRDAFEEFVDGPESSNPMKFIDTPEWTRITDMAKEVLKAFDYQKKRT